jgi:transcriptional regulator with XRE-family HTH domain
MHMSAHSEQPDERPDLAARMGEVLRARRDEQGLTLRAAALRAGLSPAHLSEVERGRKELSLSRLADVAEALDTTPGEVFLDLAVALGAAPPAPVRHPLGFAPDPREELSWVSQKLPDPELRAVAAFGSFLIAQQKGGQRQWPR